MILNVYCVRDLVADDAFVTFTAVNDGMAVRDNLPALSRVRPIKDISLYHVGSFDSNTMLLKSCPSRFVSWDAYKFPEQQTVAQPSAPINPNRAVETVKNESNRVTSADVAMS